MFDTNVKGAFFVAQEVGKRMLARAKGAAPGSYTGGRIVNIASMAGLRVLPQIGVYCMSKAAVIQMTKAHGAGVGQVSGLMSTRCARVTSTPRSTTTIGRLRAGRNWCKCYRASASATPPTWTPCW